jgi:hypothetical protein
VRGYLELVRFLPFPAQTADSREGARTPFQAASGGRFSRQ